MKSIEIIWTGNFSNKEAVDIAASALDWHSLEKRAFHVIGSIPVQAHVQINPEETIVKIRPAKPADFARKNPVIK